MCLMLPVSLDCPFVMAPSIFSDVYFLMLKIGTLIGRNNILFVNLISTYSDLYSNQLFAILDIQISSINKIYNHDIIEIV